MMRRFAIGLFLACVTAFGAEAACSTGSMPFQLQNGTVADATQVMANFNQITASVGSSCAGAGVNNDITSLNALSTPIAPSQGGTPVFAGGVTTGGTNAQVLTVASNFTLTTGYHVTGFWSLTNTGPLTMQANVSAATNVLRKTQLGLTSMRGGEAVAGEPFDLIYNGTNWVLNGERILVGEMRDFLGSFTPPPGWFVTDGSSFVCATYPELCAVLGTAFGGSSSNPNLPDTRGRVLAGFDSYGTLAGAASRLTSVATGCGAAFTAFGAVCSNASQSHTQIVAELAQHNHTDSGHSHPPVSGSFWGSVGATGNLAGGGTTFGQASSTGNAQANIQNTGSSQPMPIVNPNLGVVKIIRY